MYFSPDLEETVQAVAIGDVPSPDTEAAYGIPGTGPAADPSMPPLGKSVPINIPFHKRPVRRIQPDIEETEVSTRQILLLEFLSSELISNMNQNSEVTLRIVVFLIGVNCITCACCVDSKIALVFCTSLNTCHG